LRSIEIEWAGSCERAGGVSQLEGEEERERGRRGARAHLEVGVAAQEVHGALVDSAALPHVEPLGVHGLEEGGEPDALPKVNSATGRKVDARGVDRRRRRVGKRAQRAVLRVDEE